MARALLIAAGLLAALLTAPAASAAAPVPRVASVVVHAAAPAAARTLAAEPVRVTPVVRAPFTFDLVGARWRAVGRPVVAIRVRSAHGRWGRWTALDALDTSREGTPGVVDGEPVWAKGSVAVQLRVGGPGEARELRAVFVDGSRGPTVAAAPRHAEAAGAPPPIVTRAQWGANESIRRAAPLIAPTLSAVIVHHTVNANGYAAADVPAIVRSIYAYHVRSNGWNDIGYNYLVDAYGRIYEGRYGGISANVIGAHTAGFNTGTAGVAYIGNTDTAPVTAAGRAALVSLISWRLDLAHVNPLSSVQLTSGGNPKYAAGKVVTVRAISGHRDLYPTECPGRSLYAALPGIAADVARTGLPKIYTPRSAPVTPVALSTGGAEPMTFSATGAGIASWTIRVLDSAGATVASQSGRGNVLAWAWNGLDAAGLPVARNRVAAVRFEATSASGTAALPATISFSGKVAPPTAPVLSVTPRAVTPNGDGDADAAAIRFTLAVRAPATITVVDSSGTIVATPLETALLPAGLHTVSWAGTGADGLTPVPDGSYRVTLSTVDAAGKPLTQQATVTVMRAAAAFVLGRAVVSPNGDGRMDRLPLTWRMDEAATVTVDVLRQGVPVAHVLAATPMDVGPQTATWDGTALGPLRSGAVTVVLTAQTPAGKEVISRPLTVDLSPPVLTRAHLQGRFLRVRLSEPSYVTVLVRGRPVISFVPRGQGINGFRLPATVRRVRVLARDLAGNRAPPLVVRAS
jgi:hypothetical protein